MPRSRRPVACLLPLALLAGCGGGVAEPEADPAAAGPTAASDRPSPSPTVDPVTALFAGIPPEEWPSGADGVRDLTQAPTPSGLDPAAFAAAADWARAWITTAALDPAVNAGDPQPLVDLRDPAFQQEVADLLAPDNPRTRTLLMTPFDPATTRLLGPPRVLGMWNTVADTSGSSPTLRLQWTGSFLYPVQEPGGNRTALVAVHRSTSFDWQFDDPTFPRAPGVEWLSAAGGVAPCPTFERGAYVPDYSEPADLTPYYDPFTFAQDEEAVDVDVLLEDCQDGRLDGDYS